ncbi:hypothetical protein CS543_01825 [Porphyromonas gingivalis]|nr:hypothetical protein CS543_01825 [Porphyromonas gingivalis]PDP78043.1 hypothetical protein CLI76_01120 [Porphyromonas gingivalis]
MQQNNVSYKSTNKLQSVREIRQGNRIKNFEKIQVANFQMIAFRRLYSKIKNALKTMIDNQALTF